MKKMKKVLFLMFLLLLIGLGTVGVKAQVRIGGNSAPNGAAALDLNATDAINNGTKGLALPRVSLSSNTVQLTSGVTNLTGMLVYNTNATLGVGIYFWNGSKWVQASLPATVPADSGKILVSNGQAWVPERHYIYYVNADSIKIAKTPKTCTWTLVADTVFHATAPYGSRINVYVEGIKDGDICVPGNNNWYVLIGGVGAGWFQAWPMSGQNTADSPAIPFRCYRPSF